jgi:hypothetical protein
VKPRKQRLIIERTAYSDATLADGIPNEWLVSTVGPADMIVHARDQDAVLIHVRVFMQMQLEAENAGHTGIHG